MTPYYQDDAVTIYHGDCRAIIPSLDPVGLVLTDPPYGIGVRYGEHQDGGAEYWPWLREIVTLCRGLASVTVFTHRVAALSELTDWDWVGVWQKEVSTGVRVGNSPVVAHWEPVFIYGLHTLGTTTDFTSDVFNCRPERTRHAGRGRESWAAGNDLPHPVPKPEKLWRLLLAAFGQGGGTVLDPFLGSGTTLRIAKDVGRRAIGIEIEERYCEIAARRCAQEVLAVA